MTKLSDIQLILLTSAAQRADGSVLPPPETLTDRIPRIRTAIGGLLKHLLAEESVVTDEVQVWRKDGDARIGLIISGAGRDAIGVAPVIVGSAKMPPAEESPASGVVPAKPSTKIAAVVAMLGREGGATLTELLEATGWLPHTTRAALTGLRKKGHAISKTRRDDMTAYAITEAA